MFYSIVCRMIIFITLFILPEYKATGPTEMPKFLMVSSGKSEENIKGTKIHAY